jgi:catechol 2,3-dioxygenase-like lactoylglutathione lyase family enzyme
MKRTWTIIGVSDVPGSFKWYQSLFGQPETPPGHDYFGQIRDTDGTVLLCLHQWGAHGHPSLISPDHGTPGNGLLLFFRVDDFDMALKRARALVAGLEEEPHVNPNTQTREFSLRDPDGYFVTISALSAPRPARRRPNKQKDTVEGSLRKAKKPAGEESEPRVPTDLRKALAATPMAKAQWSDLTPTERRDFISWMDSAKQPEAHRRRIDKACAMLAAGKRRP